MSTATKRVTKKGSGNPPPKSYAKKEEPLGEKIMKGIKLWHIGIVFSVVIGSLILMMIRQTPPLTYLDTSDEKQMKSVLLAKDERWIVLCLHQDARTVPPMFQMGASKLAGSVKFGVLRCDEKMPSGRTIFQRFKGRIDPTTEGPIMFVTSGAGQPTQLDAAALMSASSDADPTPRFLGLVESAWEQQKANVLEETRAKAEEAAEAAAAKED